MMFDELQTSLYQNITNIEVILFMKYKINAAELFDRMSVLDMQAFLSSLEKKETEIMDQRKKLMTRNNIWKSLAAMRDLLNFMMGDDQHGR